MADIDADPISAPVRFSDAAPGLRERLPALGAALGLQIALIVLLASLGIARREVAPMTDRLVSFTASEDDDPSPEPEPSAAPSQAASTQRQTAATTPSAASAPTAASPIVPETRPPAVVLRQNFDLGAAPSPPAAPAQRTGPIGPAFVPRPGDSKQIGTTARGAPLYAARWYREPSHDELAGYLSVASGPGWGVIDCRTVRDFRVEDCEIVDEYPQGSGIARAAQAAAWQFRVRPPQRGGQVMVGEWVRIRIDYVEARRAG